MARWRFPTPSEIVDVIIITVIVLALLAVVVFGVIAIVKSILP